MARSVVPFTHSLNPYDPSLIFSDRTANDERIRDLMTEASGTRESQRETFSSSVRNVKHAVCFIQ